MVLGDEFSSATRLWAELSEFPRAQIDAALRHCLRSLTRILGSSDAFWVGSIRLQDYPANDPLGGWRPRALSFIEFSAEREEVVGRILREQRAGNPDMLTEALTARSGRTRACLITDLVPDDVWFASTLYQEKYLARGITDRLYGVYAIDDRHESYIVLDRGQGAPPYGERERDLLFLFLQGTSSFQRDLLRSYGLLTTETALAPRAREILQLLLTHRTEGEIAREVGMSAAAVHQYVVELLRVFRVKRRLGLMGHFLGEPSAALVPRA